jgi:hypothetical protein
MMTKEDVQMHMAHMRLVKMNKVLNGYCTLIDYIKTQMSNLEDLGLDDNKDGLHGLALIHQDLCNAKDYFEKEYEMQKTICENM